MERRKNQDLERALRRARMEPDPDFLRNLAEGVRDSARTGRARSRWFSVGLAVILTAVIVAALGAEVGGGAAASTTDAVVGVVSDVFSSSNDQVNTTSNTPADDEYNLKCNSGRGNLSETDSGTHQTDSSTLIDPHTGGTGPGTSPTDDCDPGNSGPHDSGGD
jgi:hypothetical protein